MLIAVSWEQLRPGERPDFRFLSRPSVRRRKLAPAGRLLCGAVLCSLGAGWSRPLSSGSRSAWPPGGPGFRVSRAERRGRWSVGRTGRLRCQGSRGLTRGLLTSPVSLVLPTTSLCWDSAAPLRDGPGRPAVSALLRSPCAPAARTRIRLHPASVV